MSNLSQFPPFSGGGSISTYTQSSVYTSSQSIAVPASTLLIGVMLWGGGGGGGGGRDGQTGGNGGFGGVQIFLVPVLAETSMQLTIGVGGAGGGAGGDGSNGSTTILTVPSGVDVAKVGGGGGGGNGNNFDEPPPNGGTGILGGCGGGGGRSFQGTGGSVSSNPLQNGLLYWSSLGQNSAVYGTGVSGQKNGSGTAWGLNLATYGGGGNGGSSTGTAGAAGAAVFRFYS
jgi:hypothetical protein